MTQTQTRILIVDDHPIVRAGLARLLSSENDMKVCCEADNAGDAIQKIRELKPDMTKSAAKTATKTAEDEAKEDTKKEGTKKPS